MTYAACLLFFRNNLLLGGNNGFTDFKFILGLRPARARAPSGGSLSARGLLLLGTYLFCKWLTVTKFGKVQRAIRDSENRVLFSGYAAANYKLFIFVVAQPHRGGGGGALCPAGRHHQPERDGDG